MMNLTETNEPTNPTKLWNKQFVAYIVAMELQWVGYWLLRFALPLYVLQTTGDPAMLGIVLGLSALPFIVLSPIGGIFADRFNKRKMLAVLYLFMAIVLVIFLSIHHRVDGIVPVLALLVTAFGADALGTPMMEATLPRVVPEGSMVKVQSITFVLTNFSTIGAPILGGVLMQHWGLVPVLWIVTSLYALSAVVHPLVGTPYTPSQSTDNIGKLVVSDTRDAWQFLRHGKGKKFGLIIIKIALFYAMLTPLTSVAVPTLLVQYFGRSEASLGFMAGLIGAGGTVGVALIGVVGKWLNIATAHRFSYVTGVLFAVTGVAILLMGQASYVWVIGGFTALFAVMTAFGIVIFAYVGENCPEDMVGKVFAFAMSCMFVGIGAGEFIYGQLLRQFIASPYVALFVVAGLCLATGVFSKVKLGDASGERALLRANE